MEMTGATSKGLEAQYQVKLDVEQEWGLTIKVSFYKYSTEEPTQR